MRTQSQRFRVFGVELFHDFSPQHTSGTHFGNLHKVVRADSPEERQTRSKRIDVHACIYAGTQVFETVGQGVSQLDVGRSTGLLHVVTRNGNRVEFRHIFRGVLENISNDFHREFWRIDVGVAHHKLFQNIVLNGTSHLFEFSALFESGVDVECQDGQHGTIHGHRHRHFVQRNAVEQHFHILDRADGNAGFAHVANNAFVVGIVAAVCRQVESHRETFLTAGQVAAIESVRFFGRREARILANSPRAHGVHAAIRTTQEWRQTGSIVQVLKTFEVFLGVNGFHRNLLRSQPVGFVSPFDFRRSHVCNIYFFEIRFHRLLID